MADTDDTTVSRDEAAELLGCSTRTLDRHIPPGTPGRTVITAIGTPGGRQTRIERKLLARFMPAPGGDS